MKGDTASQLDAEALLTELAAQAEDKQKAAQALEALARLSIRRGPLEDALHYYQRLARDYPTTGRAQRQEGGRVPRRPGHRQAVPAVPGEGGGRRESPVAARS